MDFQEYIKSELLILVPVLYIIGLGLKKSKLKDKWIPLVLGIISIALSAVWVVATSQITNAQEVAAGGQGLVLCPAITTDHRRGNPALYPADNLMVCNHSYKWQVPCPLK